MPSRHDLETHYLLEIREPPASMIALRKLLSLPENKDIFDAAKAEPTFEGALATIGAMLDIALDGTYDVAELCDVLSSALSRRESYKSTAELRAQTMGN